MVKRTAMYWRWFTPCEVKFAGSFQQEKEAVMSEATITRRSRRDRRTGQTDWERVSRMSDAEIEGNIAADQSAAPIASADWMAKAEMVVPDKKPISIRLDTDILEFFQQGGKNYQTRINNVLRAYVEAHKKSA